jgi:hypothetical protein
MDAGIADCRLTIVDWGIVEWSIVEWLIVD